MTIVIGPKFSVYELVDRVRKISSVINHRRTMTEMSHAIENAILLEGARGRIFSSSQRMSRFLPQMGRYAKLAENAEHVYVFGEKDTELPAIPNTTYVYLGKDDALVKEWFVVAYAPEYQSVLATRELSDIDDPDDERVFEGIWTFDRGMVDIIQEWLSSAVDARPLHFGSVATARQVQIIHKNIELLSEQQQMETDVISQEIQGAVDHVLRPHLTFLQTDLHTRN